MKNLLFSTFRNLATVMFALLILAVSVWSVCAQSDPFEKIIMSKDTELFDSAANQGLNNQPIQYVEDFGIGYSYIGDCVILRDLNFSEKQALAISVLMANGDDETLNLSVHLDDMNSAPTAIINILPTGGFTPEKAERFYADFDFTLEGTVTIYIKWLDKTGNMFEVGFHDEYADEEGFKEGKGGYTDAPPSTGDNINGLAVLWVSAACASVLGYKKHCNKKV